MVWDFPIGRTLAIVLRSWPFMVLRVCVYALYAAVFAILAASGGLVGHELLPLAIDGIGALQGGIFGAMGGVGLGALVVRIAREYTLYLVKAGHIAVMVELIDRGALPGGRSQLGFGWDAVRGRFAHASVLFGIDQMIRGALAGLKKTIMRAGAAVPLVSLLAGVAHAVADVALGSLDEIILAHTLRTRSADPYRGSADALVLFAQNGGRMVKNAAWLTLFMMLAFVAIMALIVGPFVIAFGALEGPVSTYAIVAAAIAAVFVNVVVLEPLAVCALLQVFVAASDGQSPDPQWEARLSAMPSFVQLRQGAPDMDAGAAEPAA
ncbi:MULTISPECIES: hypothetical protein [unclassified Roseitalea]|uniref:hypothetical protein n=1 Tax=unclassified Roseitalea TaxID=2639107 RepID=UPI00273F7C47|nr:MULTISPECIES: hypothetical protein [unclassified Roseitalea]